MNTEAQKSEPSGEEFSRARLEFGQGGTVRTQDSGVGFLHPPAGGADTASCLQGARLGFRAGGQEPEVRRVCGRRGSLRREVRAGQGRTPRPPESACRAGPPGAGRAGVGARTSARGAARTSPRERGLCAWGLEPAGLALSSGCSFQGLCDLVELARPQLPVCEMGSLISASAWTGGQRCSRRGSADC